MARGHANWLVQPSGQSVTSTTSEMMGSPGASFACIDPEGPRVSTPPAATSALFQPSVRDGSTRKAPSGDDGGNHATRRSNP